MFQNGINKIYLLDIRNHYNQEETPSALAPLIEESLNNDFWEMGNKKS